MRWKTVFLKIVRFLVYMFYAPRLPDLFFGKNYAYCIPIFMVVEILLEKGGFPTTLVFGTSFAVTAVKFHYILWCEKTMQRW